MVEVNIKKERGMINDRLGGLLGKQENRRI